MDGNNEDTVRPKQSQVNELSRHLSTESEDESKSKKKKTHNKEDNFYDVITSIQSLVANTDENRAVYSHNTAQSSALDSTSILTNRKGQYSRQLYDPILINLHPSSPTNSPHSNSLNFTSFITPCSFTQTQTTSMSVDNACNVPQNLPQCNNTSVPMQLPCETNMTHFIQPPNFLHSEPRNHTQSSVSLISQSDIMNVSLECPNFHNNTEPSNNITNMLNVNILNKHYENVTETQNVRDINVFDDNKKITIKRYDKLKINDNLQNAVNIQRDVKEIKQYLQKEILLLNRKLMNLAQIVRRIRPCLPRCLPLQTVEDVYQFEKISDNQYREVVQYMQYLGGLTPLDAISNAFKLAITDELSKHCTWYSAESSHAMYKTRIARAIWEAVVTNVNLAALTNIEFAKAMTDCLKYAKQRLHYNAERL